MPKRKFCGGLHVIHSDNFSLLLIYVDLLIPLVDYVVSRDCCHAVFRFSLLFYSRVGCPWGAGRWGGWWGEEEKISHVLSVATLNLLVFCPRTFPPCPATGFVYLTGLLSFFFLSPLQTKRAPPLFRFYTYTHTHTQGSFCLLQPSSFSRSLRRRFLFRQRKRSQKERKEKGMTSVRIHTQARLFLLLLLSLSLLLPFRDDIQDGRSIKWERLRFRE